MSSSEPNRVNRGQAPLWILLTVVWFAPMFGLATIFFGTLAIIASLFDGHGGLQHRIAQIWAKTLMALAWSPTEIVGPGIRYLHLHAKTPNLRANEPNPHAKTPIFASNHLSYSDTPVLFSHLPFQFRIVARSGLWKVPFIGWYLHRSGQIPVDSTSLRSSLASMNGGAKALQAGTPLVIFPEGGRSEDGHLKPFMNGPAYMAVKAGVPIVPLALIGTRELLPMHAKYLRPGRLRLAVGEPIDTEGFTTRNLDPLTEKLYSAIEDLQREFGQPEKKPVSSERMQHVE